MKEPQFRPGFRCSVIDLIVIVLGSLFALAWGTSFDILLRIYSPIPDLAVGLGLFLPVFAFFLFCNVFRVSRPLELVWAAFYVILFTATVRFEVLDWRLTIGLLVFAMTTVILIEMRRPSYHGVGWQKINPDLPTWWKMNG